MEITFMRRVRQAQRPKRGKVYIELQMICQSLVVPADQWLGFFVEWIVQGEICNPVLERLERQCPVL